MSAEEEEMERLLKQRRDRRDVFGEVISDYERLRGYLAKRYDDRSTQSEINQWLAAEHHIIFVEGVPEADEWRERFFPDTSPPVESRDAVAEAAIRVEQSEEAREWLRNRGNNDGGD